MYEFLPIATPLIAGLFGIVSGALVFTVKIKKTHSMIRNKMIDDKAVQSELKQLRQAVQNMTTKINYMTEQIKEREDYVCKTCKK